MARQFVNDLKWKLKFSKRGMKSRCSDGDDDEDGKFGIDRRLEGDITVNDKKTPCDEFESFEDMRILSREIVNATINMNWERPSKIQRTALPILIEQRKNLIAQAHHGSGKTGTFVIAMLSTINYKIKKLQGLVMCHSRELARQTICVTESLGQYYAALDYVTAIPGERIPFVWHAQVCVGTPGTILNKVITKSNLKYFLSDFKILIIDEADEFLKKNNSTKFRFNRYGCKISTRSLCDQMVDVYDRICRDGPKKFQKLLFSATFPNKIRKLAAKIAQPNAAFIQLNKSEVGLSNIRLFKIDCQENDVCRFNNNKFNTLCTLMSLSKVGQTIVFVNTIYKAQQLIKRLQIKGIKCSALYGRSMHYNIRDETMSQFREGKTVCLIASNVIARGIDVPSVGLVVNYEIPTELKTINFDRWNSERILFDSETFMHRVGRCGRFGSRGVCVNLIDNKRDEKNLSYILEDFCMTCYTLSMDIGDIKKSLLGWLKMHE